MSNSLVLKECFDGHEIRVAGDTLKPMFVAMDVCQAIGISNHKVAVSRLDSDEIDGVSLTDPIGRPQETLVVSESGLYTLILRCRDACTPGTPAHRFRKWVTSEVLPSIRKKTAQQKALSNQVLVTGERIGHLRVLERITPKRGHVMYRCECSCGNIVSYRSTQLRSGDKTDCGRCGKEVTEFEFAMEVYQLAASLKAESGPMIRVMDLANQRLKSIS